MRNFKLALVSLVALISATSFAQEQSTGVSSFKSPVQESTHHKGIFINYDYTNLADSTVSSDFKSPYSSNSDSTTSTTHAGVNGVSLGYKYLEPMSFGFDVGATYLVGMNTQEVDSNIRIYQISANGNYSLSSLFHVYAGINGSTVTVDEKDSPDVTPDVGAQAGIGFTKNGLQVLLGYKLLRFNESNDYNDGQGFYYKSSSKVSLGGFNAQVGYIF